jgi:DNA-binding beta-propeller fold protein YncE
MLVGFSAGLAIALAVAPVAAASRTVYASEATGHVMVLPVTASGGIAPFNMLTTGAAPRALVLTPNGKRLFVANSGGTTISGYDADAYSGALTADSPQVTPAPGPAALAVTPDGSMLFSANPSGSVSGFAIDQYGHLSSPPLGGATLAGQGPDGIAVSPDGTLLFVAYGTTNKLAVFAIGAGASLSSPLQVVDAGAAPGAITVAPNGSRVYVANAGDDNVSGFSVAPAGTLAPLTGSPYAAGDGAAGIAISPDGGRVLVANPTAGTISRFLVDTDGSLVPQLDTTTSLAGASAVAISPDGKSAYVAGATKVSAFSFSPTAALTSRGTDVTLLGQSAGIAVSPNLAPIATFEPVPSPAESDTHFLGALANDADGSISKWHWSFGDGASSDEASPAHPYAQPGSYTVTLTVTDAEGCSAQPVFTGQTISCAGGYSASQSHTIQVPPKPDTTPIDPPCIHDANDGFCGSPDQKAPTVAVLGFTNGSSITTLDAPEDIVGSITPDPSGIKTVRMRFTKAAGTVFTTKTTYKRVCKKVKGKKKKQCSMKKVVTKTKKKVAACLTVSPPKNYLVKYVCSKVPWRTIAGDATFRYSLPVALGIGSYTVDVTATDGAGNTDVLEAGRNQMTFKIVKTPSNGDGGSAGGGPTTTTPTTTPPIDDTGSPFGR